MPSPAIAGRLRDLAEPHGIGLAEAERACLAERQPTRCFVAAENVAALVAFLCSPARQDITGAVLPVGGGWSTA